MQRILIHIKANPFVKYGPLLPQYAAILVASSEYYHFHWILLMCNTLNLYLYLQELQSQCTETQRNFFMKLAATTEFNNVEMKKHLLT